MAEGSVGGRGPVIMAGALLVVAAALFGAVLFLYGGLSVVEDLIADLTQSSGLASQPEPAAAAAALRLPKGMSQEFALRVWQEQVDSQRALKPLAEGDIESLTINDVEIDGDVAAVHATLLFKDGSKAPGTIGMRRFENTWYVSYVVATASAGEESEASLPELADVDIELLNTVIAEQAKSRAVARDIVEGRITVLRTGAVRVGPNTVTIPLTMKEDTAERTADLVAIKSEAGGEEFWFIARFNETTSDSK